MVSVIIPAYNVEKYIRECLDSVLGQTYSDIEVIVIDDGSTDSTPEIIREYAERDSKVRLIRKPNGGPSARNAGLDVASGEWIMFVDSDDAIAPEAVETLLGLATETGTLYAEGGWTEGEDSRRVCWSEGAESVTRIYDAESYIEKVLYQQGPVPSAWSKLFYRSLFDGGLRFREGILYEDLDFFYLPAVKAGKMAVTDRPLYFYRKNPASLTGRFSPRRFDVLEVTARIEAYVAVNYPRLLPAAHDRRLSAGFNMLGLIAAHDREGRYSQTASDCWTLIRRYRRESLLNPQVRLKNKVGIILSYFGRGVFSLFARQFYRRRIR